MNEGPCVGDELHPNCGPGNQMQVRACTDGSNANRFPVGRCTGEDKIRTISCAAAGTPLPNCATKSKLMHKYLVFQLRAVEITLYCFRYK